MSKINSGALKRHNEREKEVHHHAIIDAIRKVQTYQGNDFGSMDGCMCLFFCVGRGLTMGRSLI
jgi:predicted transcriptional regulator